eukprot:1832947-Pyramimonas_sp.AAC.1
MTPRVGAIIAADTDEISFRETLASSGAGENISFASVKRMLVGCAKPEDDCANGREGLVAFASV